MTLKQARSIADTSVRTGISDMDITMATFVLVSRGAGVATRDASRIPALRFEGISRQALRAAQAAA